METIAIYPGTFDPVTTGHHDIIRRSCEIFSRIVVAIANNSGKQTLFSLEERLQMLRLATANIPRVEVDSFSGLLVDYLRSRKAHVAVRGLRAISDFEYEFQLAQMNRKLYHEFEVVYMMPDERFTYISSSLVKEIGTLGGDVTGLIPEEIRPIFFSRIQPGNRRNA